MGVDHKDRIDIRTLTVEEPQRRSSAFSVERDMRDSDWEEFSHLLKNSTPPYSAPLLRNAKIVWDRRFDQLGLTPRNIQKSTTVEKASASLVFPTIKSTVSLDSLAKYYADTVGSFRMGSLAGVSFAMYAWEMAGLLPHKMKDFRDEINFSPGKEAERFRKEPEALAAVRLLTWDEGFKPDISEREWYSHLSQLEGIRTTDSAAIFRITHILSLACALKVLAADSIRLDKDRIHLINGEVDQPTSGLQPLPEARRF